MDAWYGLPKIRIYCGLCEAAVAGLEVRRTKSRSILSPPDVLETVVVAVKVRVYKYSNSIYSGNIVFPNEALPELAKAISDFARRKSDRKMAMHLYCLDLAHAALTGQSPAPGIMIVVYDANGEAHGRSDEGFGWALKIKGAVDNTRTMTRIEVNQQQGLFKSITLSSSGNGNLPNVPEAEFHKDNLRVAMGVTNSWMSAVTIPDFDEDLILRTWKWFNTTLEKDPRLSAGAFALIEIMQPVISFPLLFSLSLPQTQILFKPGANPY